MAPSLTIKERAPHKVDPLRGHCAARVVAMTCGPALLGCGGHMRLIKQDPCARFKVVLELRHANRLAMFADAAQSLLSQCNPAS